MNKTLHRHYGQNPSDDTNLLETFETLKRKSLFDGFGALYFNFTTLSLFMYMQSMNYL